MHGGPVGVANALREFVPSCFEGRLFLAALLDAGGGLQCAPQFSLNAQPSSCGDEHATERRLEAEQLSFEADQQHGHKQTERAQDVGEQPSAQHLATEEEGQPEGDDDAHRAGIHGQTQTFERTLLGLQPAHQSQEHQKAEQEGMKASFVHVHVRQFVHILDALTPSGTVDDEKSDREEQGCRDDRGVTKVPRHHQRSDAGQGQRASGVMPSAAKEGDQGLRDHRGHEQDQPDVKRQAFTEECDHDGEQGHRRSCCPQIQTTCVPNAGAEFGAAREISTQVHARVAQPEVDGIGDHHRTGEEGSQQRAVELDGHDIAGQQTVIEITDEKHGPGPWTQHRDAGQ